MKVGTALVLYTRPGLGCICKHIVFHFYSRLSSTLGKRGYFNSLFHVLPPYCQEASRKPARV